MSGTLIFAFSIAMFINIVTIYYKFKRGNISNAAIDFAILVALTYVFGRSTDGMAIASVVSAMFSIYLFFDPIEIKNHKRTNWRHNKNI